MVNHNNMKGISMWFHLNLFLVCVWGMICVSHWFGGGADTWWFCCLSERWRCTLIVFSPSVQLLSRLAPENNNNKPSEVTALKLKSSVFRPYRRRLSLVAIRRTCLGSWRADVLHALDAADAAVGNFRTGHSYVVPETPLSIKPAARA